MLALIVRSLVGMYKQCPKNKLSYVIMGVVFVAAGFLDISAILLIILSALLGLFFSLRRKRGEKK